jgi:hypothetical protein
MSEFLSVEGIYDELMNFCKASEAHFLISILLTVVQDAIDGAEAQNNSNNRTSAKKLRAESEMNRVTIQYNERRGILTLFVLMRYRMFELSQGERQSNSTVVRNYSKELHIKEDDRAIIKYEMREVQKARTISPTN